MFSCVRLHSENAIFLLLSHISQLPNKFYNRKFQYINLKKQKSKQHHSVILREGGRESDQKWNERERLVMGNDKRATRSIMGNDGADEIGFRWIGLRW